MLKVNDEKRRIRIQDPDPDPLVRGMYPDPNQNVMDPQQNVMDPCSATAAISYPASLSKLPNGCQGHPRFCPSPPDRPPITKPDPNYVLTRCNFYSTIGMG